MKTALAFTALLFAIGTITIILYQVLLFEQMSYEQRLNDLFKQDLIELQEAKHLHPGLTDLKEVKIYAGTELAQSWIPRLKFPISVRKDGNYKLEILLLEFTERDSKQAVVQMNLVDTNSDNMLWELGRTYRLDSYFHQLTSRYKWSTSP